MNEFLAINLFPAISSISKSSWYVTKVAKTSPEGCHRTNVMPRITEDTFIPLVSWTIAERASGKLSKAKDGAVGRRRIKATCSVLLCITSKPLAQLSALPYILCITLCYLLIATCYLLLVTSAHTMYHIVLCTCLLFRCAAASIPRIYLGRSVGRWVNVVASWVIVQTLGNRSLGNQKKSVEVSRKSVEYR